MGPTSKREHSVKPESARNLGIVVLQLLLPLVRNVSVLVAIGVGADGHRRILGVAEGQKRIWKAGAASCAISRIVGLRRCS